MPSFYRSVRVRAKGTGHWDGFSSLDDKLPSQFSAMRWWIQQFGRSSSERVEWVVGRCQERSSAVERWATGHGVAVCGRWSYVSVLASSAAANNIHEPVEMTLTGAKKSIRRRRRWSAVVLLRAARDWRHLVTWSCDVVADLNSISNATPTMTTRSERHIK